MSLKMVDASEIIYKTAWMARLILRSLSLTFQKNYGRKQTEAKGFWSDRLICCSRCSGTWQWNDYLFAGGEMVGELFFRRSA